MAPDSDDPTPEGSDCLPRRIICGSQFSGARGQLFPQHARASQNEGTHLLHGDIWPLLLNKEDEQAVRRGHKTPPTTQLSAP